MLTGELPTGRFTPPSKKVQIDVRLDEVVLRAMEKEPARRYQQVSEVKTRVEDIAATVDNSSPSSSLSEDAVEGACGQIKGPAIGLSVTSSTGGTPEHCSTPKRPWWLPKSREIFMQHDGSREIGCHEIWLMVRNLERSHAIFANGDCHLHPDPRSSKFHYCRDCIDDRSRVLSAVLETTGKVIVCEQVGTRSRLSIQLQFPCSRSVTQA